MRYRNPVFAEYFADPYVFRRDQDYFAIGTGPEDAQGSARSSSVPTVFPLLHSRDLVHWKALGRALVRPREDLGNTFWAPEIAYAEGRFFLYYSVGHEDESHQLRVASSDAPEGPYRDVGPLTDLKEVPFAIDPHPFRDEDGRWYLFYARDFLDVTGDVRAGTALVVQPLESMVRLSPVVRTVLRARCDWQRFLAERSMYGQIFDWHTLEGPCVLRHDGRYYCLYSGGCWQNESYGVDFAVADHVLGPYEDRGNHEGPRVLRTVPGRVIGPGHCSVVRATDQQTLMVVYHAWDAARTARRMCIDELTFGADGPKCTGPSFTERELSGFASEGG